MTALAAAAPFLVCPRCSAPMEVSGPSVRCGAGHSFDVARQGYVNLLTRPAGAAADDAAMVAARVDILNSGVYSPIRDAIVDVARDLPLPDGAVADIGAGTGWYVAGVLDALPERTGVAVDLSVYAARRCAKAHPRLATLVADTWEGIPLADRSTALVLDVFAPRNVAEFERILAPGGVVLVVTPAPDHLSELVTRLGLPVVDPRKAERLAGSFATFETGPVRSVRRTMHVDGSAAARLAAMGPGAHHARQADLEALHAETDVAVTLAVDVSVFAPS